MYIKTHCTVHFKHSMLHINYTSIKLLEWSESWSLSQKVMFNSLWLYSPWNSPGQNTGVGSLFLLQGVFPTQGSNPGLLHSRKILYHLSHKGSQECWNGEPIPSPGDLPNPGIKPGSPALQVDSLSAEPQGWPKLLKKPYTFSSACQYSLPYCIVCGCGSLVLTMVLCKFCLSSPHSWDREKNKA